MRVIVTVGNTIFEAYTSEREVDWALVMRDMVKWVLAGIGSLNQCLSVHIFYTCMLLIMPSS